MSPSASASPSPVIVGIADEIIAIRQADNLTIEKAVATEISARAQTDNLVIKDVGNVISGAANPVIELIISRQSDDIRIVRPIADSLVIKD